jgi:hypothetical protein
LDDDEKARHALWLVATYPFALFYSAVYTESLFLVGAAGAFYHFRRREFAWAGVWGLLVGLTRPNGCLLSIALALLAVTPWLPVWLAGARRSPEHEGQAPGRSALAGALLTAAMPGVGMLLYSAFAWWLTSEPLSWVAGQREWNRSYQGLAILVTERFNYIATKGFYAYTAELPDDLLQGAAVVFVLIAVWGVIRRFGLAYGVFILVNILPPLAAGGLLSAGRLTSVLFPAFMWLAAVTPARQRPAWLAVFMAIQALNASLFYTWRGIY